MQLSREAEWALYGGILEDQFDMDGMLKLFFWASLSILYFGPEPDKTNLAQHKDLLP